MKEPAKIKHVEYRNRAKQDLYVISILIALILLVSLNFRSYTWITSWLDYFDFLLLKEVYFTLSVSAILFALFAYRRMKELIQEMNQKESLEEDYKNYRSQLHKILESLDDEVFQTDSNFRITWANEAVLKISENVIGQAAEFIIHSSDDQLSQDNYLRKAFEKAQVVKQIKYYPASETNKKDLYLEHTGIPLKDKKGHITGMLSVSRDITQKMQVEESQSRLASFIESSDDAIFVVSIDGSIHSWNSSAEKIFGYSTKEVVGQPITILDHIIDFETLARIPHLKEGNLEGGQIHHVDKVLVKNGDKTIYVSLTVYPFVDEKGKVLGLSTIARDITSSIAAEEALRESESRFRQLADTIQDAFWLVDWRTKKILFLSPAYEKIWGMTPGSNIFDINEWTKNVHPDDKDKLINATNNIVENKGMVEEFRVIDSDGSIRWIRDRAFIVKDDKQNVYRIAGIAQDITSSKLAEQALRESELRFKELFQNMSSGVTVYDVLNDGEDFRIKDFNKAGEIIDKIDKKSLIGKKLSEMIDYDENKLYYNSIKKVWHTGEPESFLFTLQRKGIIIGWRQNYIYKLPSGEVVSIFDDVTDKRNQEEALRESEERYRSFVQNFKGIAFRWSNDNIPIFMHGSVEIITGWSDDQFINGEINWSDIVYKDDRKRVDEHNEKINLIPHYEAEFEYRIVRKDGSLRWVNQSLQNICDKTNKIVYIQATLYDITQRKFAEEELLRSRQQLRNLALHLDSVREEERKQIAFEIHDELGYALTAVKLDLTWLVKKIDLSKDNLDVRTKEMSDLIETTIQKVRTISSQLRPSILDHFGLAAAIDWQAKEFQRRTAVRTRVTIIPKDVTVDNTLITPLFRIFQEALTNIARYAKASRVDVFFEKSDKFITLIVRDNGIGISEEKINDQNSFGLLGIREKAKSIGGEVIIKRREEEEETGTLVELKVPVK